MKGRIALVVRRTIHAPVERVFHAWTRPEQLRQWWGPGPVTCCHAEIDLRVGGAYRIGNRLPDGTVLWISGEFEAVEAPERLVYTWRVDGKGASSPERSRVTVRFERAGEATDVIVIHEQIDTEATRTDHEQGWTGCLESLDTFLVPTPAN